LSGANFSELRAVTVSPSDDGLRFGAPAPLFGIARVAAGWETSIYDVFPDGQRFVVAEAVSAQSEAKLTVALNWMNDLPK